MGPVLPRPTRWSWGTGLCSPSVSTPAQQPPPSEGLLVAQHSDPCLLPARWAGVEAPQEERQDPAEASVLLGPAGGGRGKVLEPRLTHRSSMSRRNPLSYGAEVGVRMAERLSLSRGSRLSPGPA